MNKKILVSRISAQLKDFLFSFVSEENCRICQRVLLARGQLLQPVMGFKVEAKPAIVHRWVNDIPEYSRVICASCWESLCTSAPLMGFYQHENDKSFAIVSGAPYKGELRQLIHRLKYDGDRLLAPDLAAIMLNGWRMGSIFLNQKHPILVPVPLHWRRSMERGFNQAELLATEASKVLDIPVIKGALKRRRATTPQQSLEKSERFTNVSEAFQGDPDKLVGRAVVIVDDVCTSGATLAECVREVIRCGATQVVALTVARTVLRKDRAAGDDESATKEKLS